MNPFAFLQRAWPAKYEAAGKAEAAKACRNTASQQIGKSRRTCHRRHLFGDRRRPQRRGFANRT